MNPYGSCIGRLTRRGAKGCEPRGFIRTSLLLSAVLLLSLLAPAALTRPAPAAAATPFTLSISDASATEGNSGTSVIHFTLSVSPTPQQGDQVDLDFTTATDTGATAPATAGSSCASGVDYVQLINHFIEFTVGHSTMDLPVTICGDTLSEANETFVVKILDASSNVTIARSQGHGTILDDDPLPSLSINNVSNNEGNSSTPPATAAFTISLSPASGRTVSVLASTAAGSATGGAACDPDPTNPFGADFVNASQTLTIPAGQTQTSFPVTICGDVINEATESYLVKLSNAIGATIVDNSGTGTIVDNDPQPTMSIRDETCIEGDSGTTSCSFSLALSAPSGQTITVPYTLSNGSATGGPACGAPGTVDFINTPGTATIIPDNTGGHLDVPVCGDTVDEPNRTFTVTLGTASHATVVDGQGTGTIQDDDDTPTVSILDRSCTEGTGGTPATTPCPVTVRLSNPTSFGPVSVDYATNIGTALGGSFCFINTGSPFTSAYKDYFSQTGTLTIPALGTQATATIYLCADAIDEPTENFSVNLSNLSAPSGVTVAKPSATVTILDDDLPVKLSINDVSVLEGNPGQIPGHTAVFTVSMPFPSAQNITVDYATNNGSATAAGDRFGCALGGDYIPASGTLTFPPFTASQTISVPICADFAVEGNETFTVALSNPVHATISTTDGTGAGTGTILDDDGTVGSFALDPSNTSVGAGDGVTYTVDWIVPSPENWHALTTLDFRLRNGQDTAIWLHWDAASNTFSLVNPTDRTAGQAGAPGDALVLTDQQARLNLASSSVKGSGPTGPSATLTLDLVLKPNAAGHTFTAEVAASDDLGHQDSFKPAGTLTAQ